ncbi:MAG: HEAT repeat domain-containing protein [Saprospiraceae bacterium]|nr:HEAT repeat domain-containing protein [Saprospiraceae bacterium]
MMFGLPQCVTDDNAGLDPIVESVRASSEDFKEELETSFEVAEGFDVRLWAPGPLLANAVAVTFSPQGEAYVTETRRRKSSDLDIREHRDWMTQDLALESLEDTEQFHLQQLAIERSKENEWLSDHNGDGSHDYRDLSVQSEQVRRVIDEDGDGRADVAQVFARNIDEMLTGVAAGITWHDGDLFVTAAPNVYRMTDEDGDGFAEERAIISRGYGIHIAFAGHDMSGLTVGPDGRIYWSIGDIGVNVTGPDGRRWPYPHEGAVMRCEPDGSGFEVFAHGLRNPQEIAFDAYGNLISVDNDGDHPGEHERYVHILQGSDSGWRIYWQFGKYNGKYDGYKIWTDERLHVPHFEGQPAYLLPPLALAPDGPAGLAFNPGTALGTQWNNYFFASYFKGAAARSQTKAFTLEPQGASFRVAEEKQVITGIASTGVTFGPDGALYINDWKDGYALKPQGRIWQLDVVSPHKNELREDTKQALQQDLTEASTSLLIDHLGHPDMRVRMNAQFELAKRNDAETFLQVLNDPTNEFAALHCIWGLGQMLRSGNDVGPQLTESLTHGNPKIQAQAAKVLGDGVYKPAESSLLALLDHEDDFVTYFAAEALGKLKSANALDKLVDLLARVGDSDPHLRHGLAFSLSQGAYTDQALGALSSHSSTHVRAGAIVALRERRSPALSGFLQDDDPWVAAEAARAIHDDESVLEALPALAASLHRTDMNEAFVRRAINANLRVGGREAGEQLARYIAESENPTDLRKDAFWAMGSWDELPVLDRVEGRYRKLPERPLTEVSSTATDLVTSIIGSGRSHPLREIAIEVAGRLRLSVAAPLLTDIIRNASEDASIRAEALSSLAKMGDSSLKESIEIGLQSSSPDLRQKALSLLSEVDIDESAKVELLKPIVTSGETQESQVAVAALVATSGEKASAAVADLVSQYIKNDLPGGIMLDLETALESSSHQESAKTLHDHWNSIPDSAALEKYMACLEGGDAQRGRNTFAFNEVGQCLRCHAISGYGGEVGPALDKIGNALTRADLLLSLVQPDARIAPGYGTVSLTLHDGTKLAGILMKETEQSLDLKVGNDIQEIARTEIAEREDYPSGMLNMKDLLSKGEIRDLVAFLASLK